MIFVVGFGWLISPMTRRWSIRAIRWLTRNFFMEVTMCRTCFKLLLCLLPLSAVANDLIPKSAPNCNIDVPPVGSGETSTHAILIKVFPRKSSVGSDYTGCQSMWINRGMDWEKFSLTSFENGQLLVLWFAKDEKDSPGLYCRFSNGKLLPKEPTDCYELANLGLNSSYAPGCQEEAIRHGGKMTKECSESIEPMR